jgi:tetratricopeptide (TPR) repeat protein
LGLIVTVEDFLLPHECFAPLDLHIALRDCRDRLRQSPHAAPLYCELSALLLNQGQLNAAQRAIEQALALDDHLATAWQQRSAIAEAMGEPVMAFTYQFQALDCHPETVTCEHYFQLGNRCAQAQVFGLARQAYDQAIARNPDYLEAYLNAAWTAQQVDDPATELAYYQRAIAQGLSDQRLSQRIARAWAKIGKHHYQQQEDAAAVHAYQQAIKFDPEQADHWSDLGCVLSRLNRDRMAEIAHQRAIALQPSNANHHYNLGNHYWRSGQLAAAIQAFNCAIQINPHDSKLHWNLSHVLLEIGDLIRGFEEYEWRWSVVQAPPNIACPLWQGEPLEGRTILLQAEQGLGDSLQFIRYASLLADRGATVWFSGPQPLHRLFAAIPAINRILPPSELESWISKIDVRSPLMSLPRHCKTTLDSIPNTVPYLTLDPQWSSSSDVIAAIKFDPAMVKIGIVWASGYRPEEVLHNTYLEKSATLTDFVQALSRSYVQLYSLQVGENAQDLSQLPPAPDQALPIDCSPWIRDFADTATICDRLDLIVSVDTSVAHLAGGLGKPTWVLLPKRADWRWLRDRPDSPWYPTMRLFRQPQAGDWSQPLQAISQALDRWLATRSL